MSDQFDVIVIGAGAAGLSAARALQRAGLVFHVLEAQDRIGGRAWTDTVVFDGVPFDRGCHWLHSGPINPLTEIADCMGLAYERDFRFLSDQYVRGVLQMTSVQEC